MTNTLTIHLHEVRQQDKVGLEILDKLVADSVPVSLGLGVDNLEAWQQHPQCYEHLREIMRAPNVELVQRGYRNICPKQETDERHTIRNPHHENRCSSFSDREINLDVQRERMKKGKEKLEEALDKECSAYCPPNGLYDIRTVEIAQNVLGYQHMVVQSILPCAPYRPRPISRHMVIVPQTKLDLAISAHVYTDLDHLPKVQREGLLARQINQGLSPLSTVKKDPWMGIQIPNRIMVPLDQLLRDWYVQVRDAKNWLMHVKQVLL